MAAPVVNRTETPHLLDPETWRGRLRQWAPLAAGPLLWTIAEIASYWIVEVSCGSGWRHGEPPVWIVPNLLVALIGIASLIVILLLMRAPWRMWDRRLDEQAHGQPYADRHQFMALASLVSGAAFGTAVLYHTLTFVLMPACTTVLR